MFEDISLLIQRHLPVLGNNSLSSGKHFLFRVGCSNSTQISSLSSNMSSYMYMFKTQEAFNDSKHLDSRVETRIVRGKGNVNVLFTLL